VRHNQISSVLPNDLLATNGLIDEYIPKYDSATGKFTWVSVSGETATTIGALINSTDSKTTPIDADQIGLMDSNASNILKKLSWENVKATLSAYFELSYFNKMNDNILLNAFRIAINGSLAIFNMIDGIMDEFEDESGVDTTTSTNEVYDSSNDLYSPYASASIELDYMEYATDGDAQTAYVTDGALISNADIDDEDMTDISDWSDDDTGSGSSSQVTFDSKSCMKLDSGAGGSTGDIAKRSQDVGNFGVRTVVSFNLYCDLLGEVGDADFFILDIFNGTIQCSIRFASDGLFIYEGGNQEVGTNLVVQDTWQEWTFDINWSSKTVNVYLNKVLIASDVGCDLAETSTNGIIRLQQYGYNSANRLSYVDWIKTGSATNGGLDVFSEDTIKEQGSYSLKGIGVITDSLNKTLTKSGLSIDLTDIDTLVFDIRSNRTGSNLKLGIVNNTYNTDSIPTMTSNSAPSGVASANSELGASYYAYKAMSDSTASGDTAWVTSGVSTGWIKYDFTTTKIITKYTMARGNSTSLGAIGDASRMPKDWTFQGSNNDSDWTTLDTVTSETNWTDPDLVHNFTFSNSTSYRYYQIVISANNGDAYLGIGELEMMESVVTEITPNITDADTWQTVTWDISSVTNANKDDIDSIIITAVNADAENTFYIDNFRVDGEKTNMTLVSESVEAEENPDSVRLVIMEEDVDAITINTDIKAYASRDDGANWVQATLTDEGDIDGSSRILAGSADVSGQASDKTMKWKVTTLNEKDCDIKGVGLLWD
jgi:hypothetical protein